ncbi:hypothetical protein SSS_09597 [Sarcoptes scabiei]|nr:hypothetical protein SSS_09597 [Sarcoptes scabiei]
MSHELAKQNDRNDSETSIPNSNSSHKCSACDFCSVNYSDCDKHILIEHQGQALINDMSGRVLSKSEIIKGFQRSLKILKKLRCLNCSKTFKSALGINFHLEICGKSDEELFKNCEICGKRLKLHSVSSHLKSHFKETSKDESPSIDNDAIDRSRKRQSSIKALKYIESLVKNDDDSEDHFKITQNRRKSVESDEDFELKSDHEERATSDDLNFYPDLDNSDIEIITECLIPHMILWDRNQLIVHMRLENNIINKNSFDGSINCYNPKCSERFKWRYQLENHYCRCIGQKLFFRCSIEKCPIANDFSKIDCSFLAHYYRFHWSIINSNKVLMRYKKFFKSIETETWLNQPPLSNSYCQVPLKKSFTNHLIKIYQTNALKPAVFVCLKPNINHIALIDSEFHLDSAIKFDRFKTTVCMENGNSQMMRINPFESIEIDRDCSMINVGHTVTCVAWCPLPFFESKEFSLSDSTDFEIFEHQSSLHLEQYLAIATTNYELFIQSSNSDHVLLQIWNIGCFTDSCTEHPMRLALNFQMNSYGNILDLSWSPFGCTYQAFDNKKTSRLGLLSTATEDGFVRIFSLPHPIHIKYAYNSKYLLKIKPILVLANRFSHNPPCNKLSWYPYHPFSIIAAGNNDGYVSLWDLSAYATCSVDHLKGDHQNKKKILFPKHLFNTSKCSPILSVRWMNEQMLIVSSIESCQLFHIGYGGLYEELENRVIYRKIEAFPAWNDTMIAMDNILSRRFTSVGIRKIFKTDQKTLNLISTSCNFNDISLSNWMYCLAFVTDNGQLGVISMLKNSNSKRTDFQIAQSIHLANMGNDNKISIKSPLDLAHRSELYDQNLYLIFDDNRNVR